MQGLGVTGAGRGRAAALGPEGACTWHALCFIAEGMGGACLHHGRPFFPWREGGEGTPPRRTPHPSACRRARARARRRSRPTSRT